MKISIPTGWQLDESCGAKALERNIPENAVDGQAFYSVRLYFDVNESYRGKVTQAVLTIRECTKNSYGFCWSSDSFCRKYVLAEVPRRVFKKLCELAPIVDVQLTELVSKRPPRTSPEIAESLNAML